MAQRRDGAGGLHRPSREELLAAEGRPVRDVIADGLSVLFCGINPGLYSSVVGHHFARPGNRFWPALHRSGFTDTEWSPEDDVRLPTVGLGITNLVERGSARADELTKIELQAGGLALVERLERFQPIAVAILGMGAYRSAFGGRAVLGEQSERLGPSRCFVLPNPSGLQARYQLPELVEIFSSLRVTVAAPNWGARLSSVSVRRRRMSWSAPLYRVYERRLAKTLDPARLPAHIGVILDGHRRYARAEGLLDYRSSYEIGMAKCREFLGWCAELHAPAVTAWVLSTENLTRPEEELEPYYDVLIELLDSLPALSSHLGFTLRVIGSIDLLPPRLATAAKEAEQKSEEGSWHFNLALGYGGRQEIVDACRALTTGLATSGVPAEEISDHIDVAAISAHLYTGNLPDPDLVIRTSGEARLSGFLLWQAAYAECVFVDPYWPAFREIDFLRALRDYARRDRRFGQ